MWEDDKLLQQKQLTDYEIDWQSWFTANLMKSTGNYKKSVDLMDIKKQLFKTDAEMAEEEKAKSPENVEEEKERLARIFKLNKTD